MAGKARRASSNSLHTEMFPPLGGQTEELLLMPLGTLQQSSLHQTLQGVEVGELLGGAIPEVAQQHVTLHADAHVGHQPEDLLLLPTLPEKQPEQEDRTQDS